MNLSYATKDQTTKFKSKEIKRDLGLNKIVRVVFDADLRSAHDGLRKLSRKLNVSVDNLDMGEYVLFINHKKNMIKIFAAGNVIAHFKMPDHRKMNMKIIAMIPRFFNGKELRYDDALKEIIQKQFNHDPETKTKG